MRKLNYNDDWIIANYKNFASYSQLAEEHNKAFNTDFTRQQMKNHAGLILKIRMDAYWYTEEMEEWICINYPKVGTSEEKAKQFNSIFGTNRSGQSLKEKARSLGVQLSDEAMIEYKKKSSEHISDYNKTIRSKPIGYIGRPSNGYPMIKIESGKWMLQSRYEYTKHHGPIPKGNAVIFLDGNVYNIAPDNLMSIPIEYQAIITANKLWSKHPEINKTSILYAQLISELRKHKEIDNGHHKT